MHPTPITPDPPAAVRSPLLTQRWLDLTFIHWAVDPAAVAPLLPHGLTADTHDGLTYVGLVAFRSVPVRRPFARLAADAQEHRRPDLGRR
ncbi:DUF2071 domain-containing protein, partial [Streptomyces sp. NPDC005070]